MPTSHHIQNWKLHWILVLRYKLTSSWPEERSIKLTRQRIASSDQIVSRPGYQGRRVNCYFILSGELLKAILNLTLGPGHQIILINEGIGVQEIRIFTILDSGDPLISLKWIALWTCGQERSTRFFFVFRSLKSDAFPDQRHWKINLHLPENVQIATSQLPGEN